MATGRNHKRIRKSDSYKYVSLYQCERGVQMWQCEYKCSVRYKTEKEAAIAVDKKLIAEGKSPINVLKRG
jgi:hypothetical protein